MNRLTRIGVIAAVLTGSAIAFSQAPGGAPNPEAAARSAIDNRQAVFKLIGTQSGAIGGLNRPNAPAPDLAAVARSAERIQVLAGMIPELFERDTREFKTLNTVALDGIWNSQADFKTKSDALASAAGKVAAAAKTGDRAATTAAAGEIGRACGSCHDAFRAKPPGAR